MLVGDGGGLAVAVGARVGAAGCAEGTGAGVTAGGVHAVRQKRQNIMHNQVMGGLRLISRHYCTGN